MNKSTKIIISTISAILALIVICLITLSCIPKNYNFNFNTDYDRIKITVNGNERAVTDKDIENKIMDLYNESFKTSMISALFNGKAFDGKTFSDGYTNVSSNTNSGYWLVISYGNNEQTLKEETNYSNKKYDKIYIQVLNSDEFTLVTAYLVNTSNSSTSSYYKYTTYAKQSNLYDYLNKIYA